MTIPDLIIRGYVLTEDGVHPRAVTVHEGVVSGVGPIDTDVVADAARIVDLADDEVLISGLVDTHVHVNEPGRTEWEGFATATAAAAAGGVTTIFDMPLNSVPATTSVEALEVKRAAAAGHCLVEVGFWGGAVPASLGHLAELAAAGVVGFKGFLVDSGVPEFPPLSAQQLHAAMAEIAAFDGLLIVHAEDPAVIAANARPHTTHYQEFLESRPPAAETSAVQTVVAAARETGCRVHIVHLSAAEALPAIVAARSEGIRLTVETCPHYLTLAAEDVSDGQTQYKCCPPVRGAANADALWLALADGVIDLVVSDHSPSTPELKLFDEGDFGTAWGGISSLQLGLSLVWTEARRRGHDLATVVRWMSTRPAELVGLSGRGRIAPGFVANLAVFAPEEQFTVDAAALRHRNAVTPYDGRTLDGVVRAAYLRGEKIDLDGPARGALLTAAGA